MRVGDNSRPLAPTTDEWGDFSNALKDFIHRLADAFDGRADGLDARPALPAFAIRPEDVPPLPLGARVVAEARAFFERPEARAALAHAPAYESVNPAISGRYEQSPKCNLFAGDVLTKAGFEVPTWTVKGGGKHYKQAEAWPTDTRHFRKITNLADVRPGDVLICDWRHRTGSGGGAHVEIVTGLHTGPHGPRLTTMGARHNGLMEDETYGRKLERAVSLGNHFFSDGPKDAHGHDWDADIYILRPRLPTGVPDAPPRQG